MLVSVTSVTAKQTLLPSRAKVAAILKTLQSIDRPFGLAIIAATPPHTGPRNPFSIAEVEASRSRAQKELDFLRGISSAKTLEVTKAKARIYLRSPSVLTARDLETTLHLLIRQLDHDMQTPLWQELVPQSYTVSLQRRTRLLESQTSHL